MTDDSSEAANHFKGSLVFSLTSEDPSAINHIRIKDAIKNKIFSLKACLKKAYFIQKNGEFTHFIFVFYFYSIIYIYIYRI